MLASTPSVPMAAIAAAMVDGSFAMPAVTTAGSTLMSSGETTDVGAEDLSSEQEVIVNRPTNATPVAQAMPLLDVEVRRTEWPFVDAGEARSPALIQRVRYAEHTLTDRGSQLRCARHVIVTPMNNANSDGSWSVSPIGT